MSIRNLVIKYHSNFIWFFFILIVLINYVAIFQYSLNFWGATKIGEWLINYEEGLVRRGAIGNLFMFPAKVFDLSALTVSYLVFIFCNIVTFFIFYTTLKIYTLNKKNIGSFVLLFSPAYILFPFYCFQVAYRKEILIFLSFSILAYAFALGIRRDITKFKTNLLILLSYSVFLISLLSHEITIFTLPFFLFLIYKIEKKIIISHFWAKIYYLLFTVSTTLCLFLTFYLSLDKSFNILISEKLCNSFLAMGFNEPMCGPLSTGIAQNTTSYIALTKTFYPMLLKNYIVLILIALIPILISNWFKKTENKLLMLFGFLSLAPLFVLATDWGRYINVYIFLLFTVVLSDGVSINFKIKKIPLSFVFIYLSVWSMSNSFGHPNHTSKDMLIYNIKNSLLFQPITLLNDFQKYKKIDW